MPLKLNSKRAELVKMDPKRRGGENGRITALHLHFRGLINKSNLKAILNTEVPPELWETEGRKAQLYPSMGAFKSYCEFTGGKVSFGNVDLTDCKVKNFVMQAHEGGMLMTDFQVVTHPTKTQIAALSDLLGEMDSLTVSANLLIDPDPEEEEEEEEEQPDLIGDE
jgi:hypothetical protein